MYASGKKSKAMCDRCGWKYPYTALREEWQGFWVCKSCWDAKHPALDPPNVVSDRIALRHPRPDNDDDGSDSITQLSDTISMTFGDT